MLKRFWMGILTILCSIGITIVISYAWFIKGLDVDPLATGSSTEAYYHSGTGTENDPFIITTPRHLYNLAWLQYLGAYNKDKKSGTTFPATYFKVGLNSSITIDMTGWPLPPIGTVQYPFIGNFNGNGSTITNLTTTNKFSEFGDKHPSGVDDVSFEYDNCGAIGFFGSVGAYNNSIISGYDTLEGYTYDTTNNKIYNFYLNDTNVHTSRSATLIGAVAGYVNAEISDVGVIKPHLNIETSATSKLTAKTSNLSDFAVVGYAEQQYTTQKTKTSTIIYNPTYDYSHFNFKGMGSQADWGGSIDMSSLYTRINGQINNTNLIDYVTDEIQYVNITHSKVTVEEAPSLQHQYKSFGGGTGAYLTQNTAPYNGYDYLTALYKNVIVVTKTETIENGYIINSNNQYLNIESARIPNTLNFDVSIASDPVDSTVWVEETVSGGVKLYTYNEDDGHKYYLVGNNDLSVGVSYANSSIWYWDGNSYYTTIDTVNYHLKYFNGTWTLKDTYVITDGTNYLGNNLANTTNLNSALFWQVTSDGRLINQNGSYLNYTDSAGHLALSNSTTVWDNQFGQLSYDGNYIQFDGTNWVCEQVYSFYIVKDNHYLTTDGSSLYDHIGSGSLWTFSENNGYPQGYISTIVNDVTYYLYFNNGHLGVTNDNSLKSEFYNDGEAIIYEDNSNDYYIDYDASWDLVTSFSKFYITYTDAERHYLSCLNNQIIDTTNRNEATIWTISGSSTYTIKNDSNMYLYFNNALLSMSNSPTNWTLDNDGSISYLNSYVQFFNGMWVCGTIQKINYNTHYLSYSDSNIIDSSYEEATEWIFTNNSTIARPQGLIYTINNDNIEYLGYNSGLKIVNSGYNWNNDGTKLYNGNYQIKYVNGSWIANNYTYYTIRYGNYYLNAQGASINTVGSGTALTYWRFTNDYVVYDYNGVEYYLKTTRGTSGTQTMSLLTGNSDSNNYYRLTNNNGQIYYYYYSYYYNYLNLSGTTWRVSVTTRSRNVTTLTTTAVNTYATASVSTPLNGIIYAYAPVTIADISTRYLLSFMPCTKTSNNTFTYSRQEGIVEPSVFNYIPLNTNDDYTVSNSNTGYLMSGGHSGSSGSLSNVDIRLAGGDTPYTISWGLSTSVNTNGTIKANQVWTYDSSGHHAINDTNNSYQKFTSSKKDLQNTLIASVNAGQAVGGIHFITSLISMSRVITAPEVLINGQSYTNYKMPENSFDFMLKKKGYINFFAGLYYPGNQSFFSLHKIERDANQNIIEIKNISKIYGSDDKKNPYVYLYKDGTYSGGYNAVPSGYNQIFDCLWIESPNITGWDVQSYGSGYKNNGAYMKRLYYFEIPVNDGEYCLGSVNGLDGGYLMYLDIGANASVVDRTTITQQSDVVDETMKYANGIQILDGAAQTVAYTSDANSCVAVIKSATTGTIAITRTGDSVSFGGTSLDSTYWDEALAVPDATLKVPKTTSTTKVLKYIDFNNGTNTLYYATVVDVDETRTFEVQEINGSDNPIIVTNESTDSQIEAADYGLLKIGTGDDAGYGIRDTAEGAITANSFATTSKVVEYHYTIPTSIVTNNGVDYSFDMSVQQVTGDETVGGKQIDDGTYEFTDGYTSTHCYKLIGDDITYVFTQIPTGTTTTTFVVTTKDGTYAVTINGITIVVGNYTYTFSTNTIA